MFRITTGKTDKLEDLADVHWENCVRRKLKFSRGSMPYELDSIIRRVEKIRSKSVRKELTFMDHLARNNYEMLKAIIVGKPNELSRLALLISRRIKDRTYPKITYRKSINHKKEFGDLIVDIFNYDSFVSKKRFWNAYELSERLGVDVCIYCNRNYTYTLAKGKKYEVRPEFDHFLPKSKYPFFAISFYNLIPSCHICNSNLKRDINFSNFTNLHPYLNSLDDVLRFTVEFHTKSKFTSKEIKKKFGVMFFMDRLDNFQIKIVERNSGIKPSLVKKAKNNCKVFKLEELYNCHKNLVSEMVLNTIVYNDSKINELFREFGGSLFSSRDDVLRHITKNYHLEHEMPKRPFSKLVKDIHKEFGLRY